jgi:hypothetical protein
MRCTHNRISFSCKMEGNSDTIMHHGWTLRVLY